MQNRNPKFIFAAGGTGGHLFPALAIADELRQRHPDSEILFVGTAEKIEARVVPEHRYRFETIWISGFHRRLTLSNVLFPLKVLVALVQSFFLIKRFHPGVVIGTGGYVCGPIGIAASILRVPLIIHESNSYPGVTTRLLASRASMLLLAFDETTRWLRRARKVNVIGTPVRSSLGIASRQEAARFFGLDPSKKTVLVFGGSLGAASINDAVVKMIQHGMSSDLQIIWQTGKSDHMRIESVINRREGMWMGPFIDRMDFAYAAADVVVCRAGATTVAELMAVGKPAILVPYPHAAADHQTHNAAALVSAGAAVLLADRNIQEELEPTLMELMKKPDRMDAMRRASASLRKTDTAKRIVDIILKEIEGVS